MPTLIRLIVILLVLVGLGYGAMFALVAMVQPRDKEVTVRIPARDLVPSAQRDPLVRREINTTRQPEAPATTPPAAEAPALSVEPTTEVPADDGEVVTRQQGIE
ncbi:MAG TPA: hypothetical protein VGV07_00730 [Devosia sp.]|jgi:hypothetical protein|uniref:hypothetical protein n=1 Tax=Devosia sp. TaxID=1871048 RepID=UPI002DDD5701|nr:hypothetical protein [Devosia sp.]HEV2513746.1 hypothetical protein [Devosia sp.]